MQASKQKTAQRVAAPTVSRSAVARMASVASPVTVQTSSLKVSSPQDAAEKEADNTARKIMRMPAPNPVPGANVEREKDKLAPPPVKAAVLQRSAKAKTEPEKDSGAAPRVQRKAGAAKEKELQRRATAEKDKEKEKTKPAVTQQLTASSVARSLAIVMPKADGQPNVASNVAAEIQNSMASGGELPLSVRRFMEPRFRADFSNVKVHTGDKSAKLNRQLNAQAFTVGNHIFFGRNKFQPDSGDGKTLLAHELTHTIQQGAVAQQPPQQSIQQPAQQTAKTPASKKTTPAPVPARPASRIQRSEAALQRSEDTTVSQRSPTLAQRLGISDALDYFADKAHNIPGYRMFTIVLGVNPINMSRVERSAANILRAVVEFMPGGNLVTQALDNHGVFDKVGNWVEQQIRSLGMTGAAVKQAVSDFLDSLSWRDIFDLGGVWQRAKRIFTEPIDQIISFVKGLISGIIQFIKDAILRPLAKLAEGTQGYDLLKAVLGQDPITGDPVPRTADTLIGGFMKLIGQDEVWNNIKKGNAVARAWAWFQGAMADLMGFVREIPSLFIQAFTSLELADIVMLPNAFAKVGKVFGNFIGRFTSWAFSKVVDLLEILFSVVAPGAVPYIKKAAGAFQTILRNPIGFVGNLVRAGKLGFQQFARNIGKHLKTSLIQWLTGTLGGAGVYIPQSFDLKEIVKFVLSVLGLTWQNIRQKLVKAVGEPVVKGMETGFDIVVTLVKDGPAAAWDKIREGISNLKEMIVEEIMSFVVTKIVQSVITKLVTSLNPAGAVIQAIIAIYNTIMFFVERIRQIAAVAASFINSISAIANGVIGAAANRVEQTMAGMLTLVISFLARIGGLGKVSDAVLNIVRKIRAPIDKALDKVISWIVSMAKKLGKFVVDKAKALFSWGATKAGFSEKGGKNHSIYVQAGGAAKLMIASSPMAAADFLTWYVNKRGDAFAKKQKALIGQIQTAIKAAQTVVDKIVPIEKANAADPQLATLQQELLQKNVALSGLLSQLVGDDRSLGKAKEKYKLEGLTGTYGSMPKPPGDDFTADHQPQAAVLQAAAEFDYFKDSGEMKARAAGRAKAGYSINLHKSRHMAGATYGSKGKMTKEAFLKQIASMTAGKKKAADKRAIVIAHIKGELVRDVAAMKSVAGAGWQTATWQDIRDMVGDDKESEGLVTEVQGRILAGENQLANQDIDSLVG